MFNLNKSKQEDKTKKEKSKPKDKKWENPNILGTNLIEEEIVFLFDWKKGAIRFLAGIILSSLSIGIVYFGLVFWQNQKEMASKVIVDKFDKLNDEIKRSEKDLDEVFAFQKKINTASFLLDNHLYWTNFFEFLEKNTLVDVYYHGFAGDSSGNYKLSATGENFNTIDQQIKAFKESDKVIKVETKMGEASGDDNGSGVDFSVDLSVDPKIFYK